MSRDFIWEMGNPGNPILRLTQEKEKSALGLPKFLRAVFLMLLEQSSVIFSFDFTFLNLRNLSVKFSLKPAQSMKDY